MKYVMLKVVSRNHTTEVTAWLPVVFGDLIFHNEMSLAARRALNASGVEVISNEVVSAGFYDPESGACWGRSESLNLDSHPDDSSIMRGWQSHKGILPERAAPVEDVLSILENVFADKHAPLTYVKPELSGFRKLKNRTGRR